jgi:hypothetical protein
MTKDFDYYIVGMLGQFVENDWREIGQGVTTTPNPMKAKHFASREEANAFAGGCPVFRIIATVEECK